MATKSSKKSTPSKDKHEKRRPRGVRPFWSGTLSFGLVNVPVHLYPAQRSGGVTMKMLAPDGTPVARRYYCPEHDRDVHAEHLIRGFELDNGEYVVVQDHELEEIEPKKSREIDLRRFVDIDEVPPLLFERSYILTPAGDTNKAYRLLADAMENTRLAGIATFVMRGKEYLVAILSENGILRAQTLRFADEIRAPDDVGLPERVGPDKKAVGRFASAIKGQAQSSLRGVDLSDTYAQQVEKLVERKIKSRKDVIRVDNSQAEEAEEAAAADSEEAPPSIDLLETIRRSLTSPDGGNGAAHSGNGRPRGGGKEDLAKLSKDELYERAKELDIAGRSGMTKDELRKALRDKS